MTTRNTTRVTTGNPDENGNSKMEAMLALFLKKQEEQDAKIAALLKENEELRSRPTTGRVAKPVTLQTSQRETTCGNCQHKIGIGADVALKYGHKPMCADCFNTGKVFIESSMRIYETQKTVFCGGCEKKLPAGSAAYYSKAKHASFCRSCAHPEGKKQQQGEEI